MYLKLLLPFATLLFTATVMAEENPIPTLDELLAQDKKTEWLEKPYEYQDGKVDIATYRGWRQFHGVCHTCHGQDAAGSTFAPNLLESFGNPELTYKKFVETVYNGRQVVKEGQQPMLAFGNNRDVIRNLDNLYAYLRARADGVLGVGRPQK
ncbi:MAG: c-type cytochrome [Gammaproteobacteria bacterium]